MSVEMGATSAESRMLIDDSFGPYAGPDVRGGFDFTLLFEESILSIAPLAIVLIVAPFRIAFLLKRERKLLRSKSLYTKVVRRHLLSRLLVTVR